MNSSKRLGFKLFFVLISGLLLITVYFIASTYHHTKDRLEQDVLTRLYSIANTASIEINGDAHSQITQRFKTKDAIIDPKLDGQYNEIYQQLERIKSINELETNIYTLFIDSAYLNAGAKALKLGIISGENQYYRHPYTSHPKELLERFKNGGKLCGYRDEHGTWLSAFAPIKNTNGEVVCVLQVDESFERFLTEAYQEARDNILIALLIIGIISGIMLYVVNEIVKLDEKKTNEISISHNMLAIQNKKISDSIIYAQRIQNAIIPTSRELSSMFSESFIYYQAKDTVGGDFPWYHRSGDNIFIAAIDCTGHGVPGALLTFIGYFLLNQITSKNPELDTAQVLELLHSGVVRTLKQQQTELSTHDGMDISLCKFHINNTQLCYAGAHRPLLMKRGNKLREIKGTRRSVGGTQYDHMNREFVTTVIKLEKGDEFFMFSDGVTDQMGGKQGKKYGSKQFKHHLSNQKSTESFAQTEQNILKDLKEWKGDFDQTDDMLLLGVKI